MMVVRNYIIDGFEYMVIDAQDFMVSRDAVRLMANRREGVGADEVLAFTGTDTQPSFVAFSANGDIKAPSRDNYRAMLLYMRDRQITPNLEEFNLALGAMNLAREVQPVTRLEIHLTESFVSRLIALADGAKAA